MPFFQFLRSTFFTNGPALVALFAIATIIGGLSSVSQAAACGQKTDCEVANGTYRIFVPEKAKGQAQIPAILHIHGLGRGSEGVMKNRNLTRLAKKYGMALIAVNGRAQSWTFPQGVRRGRVRDDFAYVRSVSDDAARRFNIDRSRIVLTGFSIGASMVWNIACRTPGAFAGYVTISGTFWRPQPSRCAAPISEIYHVHGRSDPIFPLEGRIVQGRRQGAIADTMAFILKQDRCTTEPVEEEKRGRLECRLHRNCAGGSVSFCFHGGGHYIKSPFVEDALFRIIQARGWSVPGI
ncbi:MAG: PHB depolymerase family esterase [Pseudomonadota bacterium]